MVQQMRVIRVLDQLTNFSFDIDHGPEHCKRTLVSCVFLENILKASIQFNITHNSPVVREIDLVFESVL